jgi:hypothetical protein
MSRNKPSRKICTLTDRPDQCLCPIKITASATPEKKGKCAAPSPTIWYMRPCVIRIRSHKPIPCARERRETIARHRRMKELANMRLNLSWSLEKTISSYPAFTGEPPCRKEEPLRLEKNMLGGTHHRRGPLFTPFLISVFP